MGVIKLNGFEYHPTDIRGTCKDHKTPLVNTPHILTSLDLTPALLKDAIAGMWGIGYCPIGKHFQIWYLPELPKRPNATEQNPLGYPLKINLDKVEIFD